MSVKVSIPRDIESSFNSSIAMPDSVAGEVVWQDENQRVSQSANVILQSPMVLIDSLYIGDASGGLQKGLYILQGSPVDSYKLTHYDYELGIVIREAIIPTPTIGDGSHEAVSLSLVGGNSVWVGRARRDPPEYHWHFDYVSYDLSDLSTEIKSARISSKYKELSTIYSIRFKTDGSNTIVTATTRLITTEGIIDSQETTLFNPSSVELSLTNQIYSDLCFVGDRIYGLASSPALTSDGLVTRVTVMDFNLSTINIFDFPGIDGNWVRPSINHAGGSLTHSLEHALRNIYARVYDKNMINIGSYKRNDEVIKSSTKRKYRCAVDATFDDPELGVNLSPPTWVDIGSTNKYAILDSNTSQRSIFNGGGFVSCSITSPVDTVGVFGLSGVQSATVSVISGGSTLYTETKSGMDSEFSDVEIRDIIFNIPPFSDVEIRVDFTGSNVRVGRFAVGVGEKIGRAVPGTELGDIDYSILEFDEFGNTRYVPRPIVSFHTFQVDVAKQKSLSVARKLQSIGGKDAIWSADVGLSEPLVAIGKCERFPITYDNPTIVSYTVKVRGTA